MFVMMGSRVRVHASGTNRINGLASKPGNQLENVITGVITVKKAALESGSRSLSQLLCLPPSSLRWPCKRWSRPPSGRSPSKNPAPALRPSAAAYRCPLNGSMRCSPLAGVEDEASVLIFGQRTRVKMSKWVPAPNRRRAGAAPAHCPRADRRSAAMLSALVMKIPCHSLSKLQRGARNERRTRYPET